MSSITKDDCGYLVTLPGSFPSGFPTRHTLRKRQPTIFHCRTIVPIVHEQLRQLLYYGLQSLENASRNGPRNLRLGDQSAIAKTTSENAPA